MQNTKYTIGIIRLGLIGLIMAAVCLATDVSAQTTIGANIEPVDGAILDLKQQSPNSDNVTATKGIVMPRVPLTAVSSLSPLVSNSNPSQTVKEAHKGTVVYNVGTAFNEGLYVWSGIQWEAVGGRSGWKYFYMPPFNLPLANTGVERSINLYDEYIKRFTSSNTSPATSNPLFITSEGANFTLPGLYQRTDLYYAVLDCSNHISVTSMDNAGNMKYKTNSFPTGNDAFINIILIIRE